MYQNVGRVAPSGSSVPDELVIPTIKIHRAETGPVLLGEIVPPATAWDLAKKIATRVVIGAFLTVGVTVGGALVVTSNTPPRQDEIAPKMGGGYNCPAVRPYIGQGLVRWLQGQAGVKAATPAQLKHCKL